MKPKHPSTLEGHAGYWLRCLSNFVSETFAGKVERAGVSVAQWVVLRTLYDASDVTLNEAAEKVGVDKSSLSRMIERLVQKGLVTREEGGDRRSVSLSLSAEGRGLVPRLAALADENDAAFFGVLSAAERKALLGMIHKLLDVNGWDVSRRGRDRME